MKFKCFCHLSFQFIFQKFYKFYILTRNIIKYIFLTNYMFPHKIFQKLIFDKINFKLEFRQLNTIPIIHFNSYLKDIYNKNRYSKMYLKRINFLQ